MDGWVGGLVGGGGAEIGWVGRWDNGGWWGLYTI